LLTPKDYPLSCILSWLELDRVGSTRAQPTFGGKHEARSTKSESESAGFVLAGSSVSENCPEYLHELDAFIQKKAVLWL